MLIGLAPFIKLDLMANIKKIKTRYLNAKISILRDKTYYNNNDPKNFCDYPPS